MARRKTVAGIYSLEKGRLAICINIFGKDPSVRPAEFIVLRFSHKLPEA